MTPIEAEAMIRNLNTRMTGIEQILPTLATKEDLREAVRNLATKNDLSEGLASTLAESKHYTLVLFEDLKGDIRLLAEGLAHQSQALAHQSRALADPSQKVDRLWRRR